MGEQDFADRLRNHREDAGLTLEDLADRTIFAGEASGQIHCLHLEGTHRRYERGAREGRMGQAPRLPRPESISPTSSPSARATSRAKSATLQPADIQRHAKSRHPIALLSLLGENVNKNQRYYHL